jgi:colicin import membrane protein
MTPIRKVAGIGQALAAHLAAKGISTAEQLAKTSPETLRSIPRLGAQRASGLLAAAQKIVAGSENQATVAAPAEDKSAVPAAPDPASTPRMKTGKNAGTKGASAKSVKKAAKVEKTAKKKVEKAEKAAAEKTAKKVAAKAAKVASEKKAKAEKTPKKNVARAANGKAEKVDKSKSDKTAKPKKKKQSKKK